MVMSEIELSDSLMSLAISGEICKEKICNEIPKDISVLYLKRIEQCLNEHVGIQDKLEKEINIRDGTSRLLAACTHEDQLLEAAKNLHTSNARIYAYMTELQKIKTSEVLRNALDDDQVDSMKICKGLVSISEIRIPLMWGDPAHPANKSKETGRFAVFCLLSIASEVQDTLLVCTDRTTTDICFQDVVTFDDVTHDFEVTIEVLAYPMSDQSITAQTPQKLFHKLNRSVGKKEGRVLKERMKENSTSNMKIYPQFQKLGGATLNISNICDEAKSHDMNDVFINGGASRSRPHLSLYGTMSCRLIAQAKCVTDKLLSGFLNCMEMVGSIPTWTYMWCEAQGGRISCWLNPEDTINKTPSLSYDLLAEDIKINEIERIRQKRANSFQIRDTYERHIFAADLKQEQDKWIRGLRQHRSDCRAWRSSCVSRVNDDEPLQAMTVASPIPSPLTPTVTSRFTPKFRQAYNNIDVESPTTDKNDDMHASPKLPEKPWAGFFNGALTTSGSKITKITDVQTTMEVESPNLKAKPPVPRRPAHDIVERKRQQRIATLKRTKHHSGSCSDAVNSDACASSDDVFLSENDEHAYDIISSHDDVIHNRIRSPPQRTSTKKKKKRRAPMPPQIAPITTAEPECAAVKITDRAHTRLYHPQAKSMSSTSSLDDILEDAKAGGRTTRSGKPKARGVKVLPSINMDQGFHNRCNSWDADRYLRSTNQQSEPDYEEIRPRTCSVPILDKPQTPKKSIPVENNEFVPSPLTLGRKPVAVPRRSYLTAVEGNKHVTPPDRPLKSVKVKSQYQYTQWNEPKNGSPLLQQHAENNENDVNQEPVYAKVNKARKKPRTRDLHIGVDAYTKAHRAIITVCKQRMEEEDGKRVKVVEKTQSTRLYSKNGRLVNGNN